MKEDMKIVVHGTKGGYHTFTDEKIEMIDARPDSNKVAAIGREAYAINFNEGNVIFSKYKIIRDVIGDKRTGHIAFSVIIPNEKKLSGANVKSLLDELAENYCSKYIENNNLDNVREDWQFVEGIKAKFIKNIKKSPIVEKFKQGTKEAAFIYYSSDDELQEYFNNPYVDKYEEFKQIFFVNGTFESKPENPLNALRHNPSSDLTKITDIQNLKYTLLFDETSITVQENNAERKNKSIVLKKSTFKICYSEPHCHTVTESGTLNDIKNYIVVNHDERTIQIKKQKLKPIEYTFNFKTTFQNSPIENAKIIGPNQEELHNPFRATYEKIKDYKVRAEKEPDLISDEKDLKGYVIGSESIDITLHLKKRPKEINIIVKNEDGQLLNIFEVLKKDFTCIEISDNIIKFYDSDINKETEIFIQKDGYERSSPRAFIPEQQNEPVNFTLKRAANFLLDQKNPKNKNLDVEQTVTEKKPFFSKLESHLTSAPIPIIIICLIIFAMLIGCVIYIYKDDNKRYDEKEAKKLLEGTILDSSRLEYLQSFCEPKPDVRARLHKFFTGESKEISLPSFCSEAPTIYTVLKIYKAIKQGNIDTLQQIETYSSHQENFKKAIMEAIEYKTQIGDSMRKRYEQDIVVNLDSVIDFIKRYKDSLATPAPATPKAAAPTSAPAAPKAAAPTSAPATPKAATPTSDPVAPKAAVAAPTPDPVAPKAAASTPNPLETEFWNLIKEQSCEYDKFKSLYNKYKDKYKGCIDNGFKQPTCGEIKVLHLIKSDKQKSKKLCDTPFIERAKLESSTRLTGVTNLIEGK